MKNFIKYAQYYNILYKDKDYKKEVDYVDHLIRRCAGNRKRILLDIGCGTGEHDFWFVKKGYQVVGIDRSSKMIAIARNKVPAGNHAEFYIRDVSKFTLSKKFDAAVSLFHVMSYLAVNEVFIESLKNIYNHLKKGGLFIFDFWYGPAVLTQRPSLIVKKLTNGESFIKRTAIPKINFNEDVVDIHYKLSIKNKNNHFKEEITEHHMMRYFFLPELYLMLAMAGFRVIKCLKWMSLKEGVSQNSWSGVIIAKK